MDSVFSDWNDIFYVSYEKKNVYYSDTTRVCNAADFQCNIEDLKFSTGTDITSYLVAFGNQVFKKEKVFTELILTTDMPVAYCSTSDMWLVICLADKSMRNIRTMRSNLLRCPGFQDISLLDQ